MASNRTVRQAQDVKGKTSSATYRLNKGMRNIAKSVFNKHVETKTGLYTSSDGQEISHKNFITITNNLLATSQGVGDEMAGVGQRLGDEIKQSCVSIKMMLELNKRYLDVTFRILVVRAAKSDALTKATLFTGTSGNKMLDTIHEER